MAEMTYYPVCLDIRNRHCLVVGGGAVALRKAEGLLDAGARVTVVSPEFAEGFSRIDPEAPLYRLQRPYADTDLNEKFLVIGATDNSALNRQISRDAHSRNMLCNIADVPEACNFVLPAVVRRGDLSIAISTSGRSPAFARHLRKQLENQFGPEYTEFLRLMGAIRQKLLAGAHAPEAHKPLFEQLINGGLLELVAAGRIAEINELLTGVLGPGYDYGSLMASAEEDN